MAALGKIRSRGVILICIISLGLFAFIAEELFRSCETTSNDKRQQVGEVLGEKINVQDFQKLVDEYTEVIKMQQGQSNLNDEQLNQVKDMVWNTFIQNKIVEHEADRLGLTVTDDEIQNVLNEGTNQMLLQTPFVNQQTGRFDVNSLKKFLAEYKTQQANNSQTAQQYTSIYKYWLFVEKNLRQQLLSQKYQMLLAHCVLSNPVEAKMSFKEDNEESQIQLAAFPYSSIDNSKVKLSNSDIKAKYDELKPRFKQNIESRDIHYVDYEVTPSATDRAAVLKLVDGYAKTLATAADPTDVVRKSASSIAYLGLPVDKGAYPQDISGKLDSMSVGQTFGPVENKQDNTLNVIKLISKDQLPDSVQFRMIQVAGSDAAATSKTADSIATALRGGADFEVIAKKYGQTGEKSWMTTRQYESAPSIDKDTRNYIEQINTLGAGEIKVIPLSQGNIVLQVLDRKNMITKYTAAVIKKSIEFTRDTYSAAYNKFSSFVSANQTGDAVVKNAVKYGYKVQQQNDVTTSGHYLANIHNTRDALKWLFSASEGSVSPMYECGDNNHLLIVILDKIHKKGYRPVSDPQVLEMVKAEVMKDKKAEMIMAKLSGVNSISAAAGKGAKVSNVNQITFSAPAFIQATGASEPALSGAVSATAKGQFSKSPVKGQSGVYMFQVVGRTAAKGRFDDASQEQKLRQGYMQYARNFMNELYLKANVTDNRYMFF
jgi:peptidyl-prolyl cis-trans isomerase D